MVIFRRIDPGLLILPSFRAAGRVIGGTGAAVVGLAAVLFAIFAIRRRFLRSSDSPGSQEAGASPEQSDPHSQAPISPPKSATSETFHACEDEDKAQGAEKDVPPTPTSDDRDRDRARASPLPVLPLTRRRSWTSRLSQGSRTTRSQPSLTTDESNFLQFAGASIFPSTGTDGASPIHSVPTQGNHGNTSDAVSRPDSPTLPDTKSLKSLIPGLPATPKSYRSRSQRSQRSEKREHYLKLDKGFEPTRVSGEKPPTPSLRSPSSWRSTNASLASRASRTLKDH